MGQLRDLLGEHTNTRHARAKLKEKKCARLGEQLLFCLGHLHRFCFLFEQGLERRELCSEWCSDRDCETVITCNETWSSRKCGACRQGSHHRCSAKWPLSSQRLIRDRICRTITSYSFLSVDKNASRWYEATGRKETLWSGLKRHSHQLKHRYGMQIDFTCCYA